MPDGSSSAAPAINPGPSDAKKRLMNAALRFVLPTALILPLRFAAMQKMSMFELFCGGCDARRRAHLGQTHAFDAARFSGDEIEEVAPRIVGPRVVRRAVATAANTEELQFPRHVRLERGDRVQDVLADRAAIERHRRAHERGRAY